MISTSRMDYFERLVRIGRVIYARVGHANQRITLLFVKCHARLSTAVRENEPPLNVRPLEDRGPAGNRTFLEK